MLAALSVHEAGAQRTKGSTTEFCWKDSATGVLIPTTPIGASPTDYIPGDDHWENPRNSKTYVHLPDGSWIDAQTGTPVPTEPLGASPQDFIPGEDHWENPRNGKTYFRTPCPPRSTTTTNPTPLANTGGATRSPTTIPTFGAPTSSDPYQQVGNIPGTGGNQNPTAPPPTPNPLPTGVRTNAFQEAVRGVHIGVGGAVGATGLTTTYDDGYKIGSTQVFGHGYLFITEGLGHAGSNIAQGYLSVIVGATAPTGTTSVSGADTQLKFTGNISAEYGHKVATLPGGQPMSIFVQAGPSFAVESAGASATIGTSTYSYSDTEKMFGFTVGGGVKVQVAPHLQVTAGVDYTHLNQTSFASPSGSYNLGQTGTSGGIGIDWRIK
jgi:opacity protein-like surface antigen